MKQFLCLFISGCLLFALVSCSTGNDEYVADLYDIFRVTVDQDDFNDSFAEGYVLDKSSYKYYSDDFDNNGYIDFLLTAEAIKDDGSSDSYRLFMTAFGDDNQVHTGFHKIINSENECFQLLRDENGMCFLEFYRDDGEDNISSVYPCKECVATLSDSFACDEGQYYYSDFLDLLDNEGPYTDDLCSDEETFNTLYYEYSDMECVAYYMNGELNGFIDYDNSYDSEYNEVNEDNNEESNYDEEIYDSGDETVENDAKSDKTTIKQTKERKTDNEIIIDDNERYPTKKELEQLGMMANNWQDFDSSVGIATEDIYRAVLVPGGFYGAYYDYGLFEDYSFVDEGEPDPRAELESQMGYGYSYYIYPGDGVDRFLREVMNVEPDHDYADYMSDGRVYSYYENGNYYVWREMYGDEDESKYVSHTNLPDGKVAVKVNVYDIGDDRIRETKVITASIKIIDGRRVWSIYSVERTYSNW